MKIFILLVGVIVSSCNPCTFAQISPQYIYAGENCTAPVPDYTLKVIPSDNCKLSWLIQDPSPGWLLSADNPTMTVSIRAGDVSGNIREIRFTITLIDTIKPTFQIDPSLLSLNWDIVDKLYNTADKFLVDLLYLDKIINEESPPRQIGNSYFTGVDRRVYPVLNSSVSKGITTWNYDGVAQVDSSIYKTKILTIRTPPEHAFTGIGKRTFTFE